MPPNSLPHFILDWQVREDAARNDPHHALDHAYREWLVEHAPRIRALMEAQETELTQWRDYAYAYSIPRANDIRQAMDKTSAAIKRLVNGK